MGPELISKIFGNRVACSPIVTVEPRRRKFHKPITLTIPVPKAAQKGMINQYANENPTLRLLCSITGELSSFDVLISDIIVCIIVKLQSICQHLACYGQIQQMANR